MSTEHELESKPGTSGALEKSNQRGPGVPSLNTPGASTSSFGGSDTYNPAPSRHAWVDSQRYQELDGHKISNTSGPKKTDVHVFVPNCYGCPLEKRPPSPCGSIRRSLKNVLINAPSNDVVYTHTYIHLQAFGKKSSVQDFSARPRTNRTAI